MPTRRSTRSSSTGRATTATSQRSWSPTHGSPPPTTATAASATPAWSSTSARTTRTPAAPPARSRAARRSTSGACAWTARSSAGAWRAATASAATTCCGASTWRSCRSRACALVVAAEPVPEVELEALARELLRPHARQARQHRLERLLLGHAGVERLLAPEPGGDLQRLAPVLAQRREDVDQEVAVGDRLADLERRMPRGQHREVVLVE